MTALSTSRPRLRSLPGMTAVLSFVRAASALARIRTRASFRTRFRTGYRGRALGLAVALALVSVGWAAPARAQNQVQAEDHFREIFLTAGYATAFGAAMGAAMLPFFPEPPAENLRFIAGGASLGFIFGSAWAFYNISRNSSSFGYPQEAPDAFEDADPAYGATSSHLGRESGMPRSEALPQGALFVGQGARFGVAVPAVQWGKSHVGFALAHFKF